MCFGIVKANVSIRQMKVVDGLLREWGGVVFENRCRVRCVSHLPRVISTGRNQPATPIPEVVSAGSLDGHTRAYDELDGTILWDFDTARELPTVNLVESHG